jgi:uncharacterized protein (DUF2126 family)
MKQNPSSCARQVEALLQSQNITLTVGGEPTFVPLNPEGAEWSVDALGPTKLDYARKYFSALMAEVPQGAVLYHSSGKHYPGEPLPRWSLQLVWTLDSIPYWKNPKLLQLDDSEGTWKNADARKLLTRVRALLQLKTPILEARASHKKNNPIEGFVLPLDFREEAWITDTWPFHKDQPLFPLVGDSLLGLRLPLSDLPDSALKRAMTIEIRRGNIEIFLPPLDFEPHRFLTHHIEQAATELKLNRLVLNGYPPPSDPRFSRIGLASDPGVIEVNLPACADWAGYDSWMQKLYRTADKIGLCARKFGFNGKVTGTGGGAHLCFGGPEPMTSPFFTRPDLLPSMIRYWQNHPALSYVFTGQFLGPSCQAPRIDESSYDAMAELDIACRGAVRLGEPFPHPLYQMLFADLLMDRSGNTHRAEISVDKLWNAQQPGGTLGIVELRAFEAFPDPHWMSNICLFVRAILARLILKPYDRPFIRFGTSLHDKFLMPSVLWDDLLAVIEDLKLHGIDFSADWLRPLFDFRFPVVGVLPVPGGKFTVRQAPEPWPLLGEKSMSGATSRFVDSSTERLEIHADKPALIEKGIFLVNGVPMNFLPPPDQSTAVRFRAFYVVPGLHPHVPLQSPLLLEWVDAATKKVTAAARYHAWNPNGGEYAGRPTTDQEARQRFKERWQIAKETLGQTREIDLVPSPTVTVDLRALA